MQYKKREWDDVDAFELEEPFGKGKKGDYIVISHGGVKIMTAKRFNELYEPQIQSNWNITYCNPDWMYINGNKCNEYWDGPDINSSTSGTTTNDTTAKFSSFQLKE